MATPKQFPKQNLVFRGWPEDENRAAVLDLPTYQSEGAIVSCWKLSQEELENVAVTGEVWVMVQGTGQPPIYITGKPEEVIPE